MHPGSQQDQRLSPALAPGYFRPDELSLAQRLRQVLQLGRHLRFIDTQGSDAGHWGQMLEQDLSILLAEIAAQPVDDLDAEAGQFAWMPPTRAFGHCLRLARQLDRWYALLDDDTEARDQPIRQVLRQPIERALTQSLGKQLQAVLWVTRAPSEAWAGWHTAWGLHARLPQADEAGDEPAGSQLRRLRLFWMAMCRLVRLLSVLALQQLPASLTTGLHEPGVGLLLAWTQLLQQTREPLNLFDTRLTHHYYTERLGFLPLPAGADRVHLVLDRDPRHPKPVMLPPGWRFVANLDRGSSSYAAEHALHVSPLKVTQLLSLRHVFDRQISPEHEYGFASEALARQVTVLTTDQAAEARAPSVPLMGGGTGSSWARQGIAVASPVLALREGVRDVEITLNAAAPDDLDATVPDDRQALLIWCRRQIALEAAEGYAKPDPTGEHAAAVAATLETVLPDSPGLRQTPWLAFLLARCLTSAQADELRPRLGRFLAAWLCATGPALDEAAVQRLRQHVRSTFDTHLLSRFDEPIQVDDPLSLLFLDEPPERALVFDRVFRGAWHAQLPIATGWLDLGEVFVRRVEGRTSSGIVLSLRLSADLPPIVPASEAVHGPGWPTLPVLQLLLHNRSRLFASSLLQQLRLDSAEVAVAVRGARCLQLHNQLGRLDPGKPFMPLGPLPDSSAYLLFTHAELVAKPLEHLCLNLRWAGLPPAGLARHYAEYPGRDWDEPSFRVQLSLLTEGRWQTAGGPTLPLFGARGLADHHLEVAGAELLRLHHPTSLPPAPPGQPAEAPEFGLGSRQGFFKLQLAGPPDAFGHALYPRLMAETLTANSRLKPERARPLPETPYTPVLESMTVDYRARQRIAARVSAEHAGSGELLHITPFGVQALRQVPPSTPVHVLQRWHGAGQLFIGLDGPSAEGGLSLLFKLRSEAAREALGRPTPALQWHAWRGHDWVAIEPHRVLLDSTEGMLRTGLVVLDLPAGLTRGCTSLPGHSFWLRLSGQGELDLLAGLIGVWTNGLCARRLGDFCDTPLPAGRIRAALEATPGLATVRQPWPSFDLRPQETPGAWATRVSERLRHRARVISPWDCERLVLQAFPEVFKLKCIPRTSGEPDAPVTVVVVPTLPAGSEIDGTEAPRLDASTLQRIAAYLTDRMPPHQPLLVRNATYERIQVRCTLRLARSEPSGERLRELNQSLRDYLSPWRPGGITTRFDWQLRADEVEAFLRGQPGVEAIGQVSLLHIVSSDQHVYTLLDTARGDRHVRPAHAWSLALPTRGHLLELVDHPLPVAQASGLSKLSVAGSFIIGKDAA